MNYFHDYTGFSLNGRWLSREFIDAKGFVLSYTENAMAALAFAKELFGEDEYVDVTTSGSTGQPKSHSFSKTSVLFSAMATNRYFNLSSTSKVLLAMPMQYIAGKMMVARAICEGYNLDVVEPSATPLLEGKTYDFVPVTPFQMVSIIEKQKPLLPNVGKFLVGGGAISEKLKALIVENGIEAYASFGMAETLSHIAIAKIEAVENLIYKPLKNVELKVDNTSRLQIKRWGRMDWLQTNDLVELVGSGFEWLGRADNLINSGGVKIIPEKVEKMLEEQLKSEFFIHGISDEKLGQAVALFIEGEELIDLDTIAWNAPYEKPRKVFHVPAFERTVSGKVKRAEVVAGIKN